MTLTLIDPSTAAVVQHLGGMITVRCADYVGSARAGLSTVSDALAAAGTAVKEEQTVTVDTGASPTSHTTRFGSVADSVRIPIADLDRLRYHRYLPFVSVRVEGEPPMTAHAKGSWVMWDVFNATNMGVSMGIGTVWDGTIDWLPSDRVGNYILQDFRNNPLFEAEGGDTDAEDFVIRAWGPAGGDIAIFLEAVYFVPILDAAANYGGNRKWIHSQYFPSDKVLQFFSNGTLWEDIDNDPSDLPEGFGKFGTLGWESPWVPGSENWGQVVDFQAADNEVTTHDHHSNGLLGPPDFPSPISAYLHAPVGATYVPQITLLTDDFTGEQHVHPTYEAHYVSKVGDYTRQLGLGDNGAVTFYWDAPPPFGIYRGTHVLAGDGYATTFFGPSSGTSTAGVGHELPGGLIGYFGFIRYGASEFEGGFAASEANVMSNRERRVVPHLESFTAQMRVSVVGDAGGGDGGAFLGMYTFTTSSVATDHRIGATLAIDSSGDIHLSLDQARSDLTPEWSNFAAPVLVGSGYTPGDWWWIKVERKAYTWRARAWADGDPEPSTWDVEEFQPLYKSATGAGYVNYPWDDNWVLSVNNDAAHGDPRAIQNDGFTERGAPYAEIYWVSGQTRERILTDDFSFEWDPYGTSPDDIHVRVESYDGASDYGTVTVPYGAHRFVRVERTPILFDDDTHGWNMRLWREASNPDLMPAGLGRMFIRFPLRRFRPQIYRRTYG